VFAREFANPIQDLHTTTSVILGSLATDSVTPDAPFSAGCGKSF
jgi:hypothetical protein